MFVFIFEGDLTTPDHEFRNKFFEIIPKTDLKEQI